MTEKHIEETPEMAKARKAKAALKNVAASTAEILQANDAMARAMRNVADDLKRNAHKFGEVFIQQAFFDNHSRAWANATAKDFLLRSAELLERGAV